MKQKTACVICPNSFYFQGKHDQKDTSFLIWGRTTWKIFKESTSSSEGIQEALKTNLSTKLFIGQWQDAGFLIRAALKATYKKSPAPAEPNSLRVSRRTVRETERGGQAWNRHSMMQPFQKEPFNPPCREKEKWRKLSRTCQRYEKMDFRVQQGYCSF